MDEQKVFLVAEQLRKLHGVTLGALEGIILNGLWFDRLLNGAHLFPQGGDSLAKLAELMLSFTVAHDTSPI